MVDLALDKYLIPDLANIVLEYCQLERVDEVNNSYRHTYTMLFGRLHGEYKLYYSTGELIYSHHYVNGKQHGESKGYYTTGEMYYSKHYVNDKLHGVSKCYYLTGELIHSHHYVNGVKQ